MIRYLFTRLWQSVPVFLGVVTLVFLILHSVPGDPVDILLGDQANDLDRSAMRASLGLDQPLVTQYFNFLKDVAKGDLGESLYSREPVAALITERLPATFELAFYALLLSLIFGIPLGVLAAMRPGSPSDHSLLAFSLLGISLPSFFLGPILIWVFSLKLGWFPVSERLGFSSLVLPSITLAAPFTALLVRMTRASLLEVVNEDYILVAKAKGLNRIKVYFKHALRNALMPVITIVGLQAGVLLTGTVITETIFDWPGLGTLLYQAINERDFPVVQGTVLFIAVIYVLVNLLTDFLYAFANPKVELES